MQVQCEVDNFGDKFAVCIFHPSVRNKIIEWRKNKYQKVVSFQKGFYAQILSSVLLPFLLFATIWFFIPIKTNEIKKRRIKSPLQHIYTKNYTRNWIYTIF
ncbi:hypothetical protein CDB3_30820 [Bacillus sp. CDB3]|nr:hypothetical protein CDB3_30820 [Bacillus sp. CDB3]